MATNLNVIQYDNILTAKEKYEIYKMIIERYKAIYGADISTEVYSADIAWINAIVEVIYDFAKTTENVYSTFNINNARGKLLEDLVFLSGNITRKTPTKTLMRASLSWTGDDISYTAGSTKVLVYDSNERVWLVTPVDPEDTTIYATGTYDTLGNPTQLVYLTHSYEGDILLPSDNSLIQIRVNGDFLSNTSVAIDDVVMIQRGSDLETDNQLRARRKGLSSFASINLTSSIKQRVLNSIFSIADIKIYNSNGSSALTIPLWDGSALISGGVAIPAHDIFVLIKPVEGVTIEEGGASSVALAEILQKRITLGISTRQADIDDNYHSVDVSLTDDPDLTTVSTETYRYYVAQPYNPSIVVNYVALDGFNLTNSTARIREALYNLSKEYPIDKDISVTEVLTAINNQGNLDPTNPTFIVSSVSIGASENGVEVNNGYWLVDSSDMSNITLSEVV